MCSNVYDDVTDFVVLQIHQKQKNFLTYFENEAFFLNEKIFLQIKKFIHYTVHQAKNQARIHQFSTDWGKKFSPAKPEKDFSCFSQSSCTVYSLFLPFKYIFDPLPLLKLLLAKTITYIGIKSCTLLKCQMSHTMKGS